MRRLEAADLIAIWEHGHDQDGIERALTILGAVAPDRSRDDLARLPIGRRDLLLLAVRSRTFGRPLASVADCPTCREQLECALDADAIGRELAAGSEADEAPGEFRASVDGFDIVYRLPTSDDLLAAAGCADLATARALLIERCIGAASHEGDPVSPCDLPTGVLAAVAAAMEERDQASLIDLDLTCPSCGHRWQAPLDIAGFFWAEIAAAARRLVLEVNALARAYGWREEDILTMSAARRQCYMDLVL